MLTQLVSLIDFDCQFWEFCDFGILCHKFEEIKQSNECDRDYDKMIKFYKLIEIFISIFSDLLNKIINNIVFNLINIHKIVHSDFCRFDKTQISKCLLCDLFL